MIAAAATVVAAISLPAAAAPLYADVVTIVDESGSMAGEHAWLGADGYSGINFANGYTYRSDAARNYILVTDEDRDNGNASLTFSSMLTSLLSTGSLLNAVVDATFRCAGTTAAVLGIGTGGVGYVAGANGTFTTATGCTAVSAFGSTITDYVNLALQSGGAAWNLNILRGGGNNAVSFTNAFVDIKVSEITNGGGTVPEPGSLALVGTALLGLAGWRRRKAG